MNRDGETITLNEAARRIGVTAQTVALAIKKGQLETVQIGNRRRVTVRSLERLMRPPPKSY